MGRTESAHRVRSSWLKDVLENFQGLVDLTLIEPQEFDTALRGRLNLLPATRTRVEALLLRGLMSELALRRLVHSDTTVWYHGCEVLLERIGCKAQSDNPEGDHSRDPRVTRALRVLQERAGDPELHLQALADAVGLSVSHFDRLLRRETRAGSPTIPAHSFA